ncbi:MAG TPA: hypothetical protein PKC76_18060 [Saprospiraceae bacterium]|nr:hypothetical protein [Saprospiraceae bacterium]HMP26039.1 hypothetical protein [Saprospiraceae bacterium]
MKNPYSLWGLLFCYVILFAAAFLYYPKWQQTRTEATISWDVAGYYTYLPAFFIYHDAKQLNFMPDVIERYYPVPNMEQLAFRHTGGNYVMKYPAGQALQWTPFFAAAHWYAKNTDYTTDGYSAPYQFMISIGSLLIAFLGLWLMRWVLLRYFNDRVAALSLIFLVLGTNYLDYASINGAMTHNNLFTIYAALIYFTLQFYDKPTFARALGIGLLVGLAGLTRPTELISAMIPVLWGLQAPWQKSILERLMFFKKHLPKLLIAVLACALVGSIQLMYWKYAAGEWIVYSYQDQGFSWLRPHLKNGLFSYRSGWLVYTPIMIFALVGFIPLYKKQAGIFWTALLFCSLFIYIAFAWDIWWYGGSLGQRTMVQCYPMLLFPFAAFIQWVHHVKWLPYLIYPIFTFFSYFNLWITHQAHRGGLFVPEQMNRAYFQRIFLRYNIEEEDILLLDVNERFSGQPKNIQLLYQNDFEQDTTVIGCGQPPIAGQQSLCLNAAHQFSPIYEIRATNNEFDWLRATATFHGVQKEWNTWSMTQFIIRFYNNDQEVKTRIVRVHRLLSDGQTREIGFDVQAPRKPFNKIGVFFWNADSPQTILIDNLRVESFDEK